SARRQVGPSAIDAGGTATGSASGQNRSGWSTTGDAARDATWARTDTRVREAPRAMAQEGRRRPAGAGLSDSLPRLRARPLRYHAGGDHSNTRPGHHEPRRAP